ncbi:MAG: tRNA (adenosine(37)-N6)-dimethylallyltransferase MiaA [Muribaculaceae bacterium]|nr:tRNA (adenosine(37)-N6)-dimethylallyltransferase MiaA [Muribaculaceae bacterium]
MGPTASGKTRRAVDVARAIGAEIISADSRQVYRGMDIGTGKDLDEYGDVKYHLIDIADAGEKYNLYNYLRDYRAAVSDIEGRGRRIVVCGGTGMYVESAINGLALPEVPENRELREELSGKNLVELTEILKGMKTLHNVTDVDTAKRAIRAIEIQKYYLDHPDLDPASNKASKDEKERYVIVEVDIPREERRRRITERLERRMDEGMTKEVENLIASGVSPEALMYYGLEYKYVTMYVTGQLSARVMSEQLQIAIHQFAKRQETWFRGMERRGHVLHRLPWDMGREEFVESVKRLLGDQ